MKSKALCLLGCLVLIVGVSGNSWGQAFMDKSLGDTGRVQEWEPIELPKHLIHVPNRLGIGARIGHYCPADADKVDGTVAFEGMVAFAPSNTLLVLLSTGYVNPDLKIGPEDAEAELNYLSLTLELRGEPMSNFGIYLGFGPTLFFEKFKNLDEAGTDCKETVCGGNLSFGIDYFVTQFLAINIDCKYIASFKDVKCVVDGVEQKMPNLDGLVYGAGLKFFF